MKHNEGSPTTMMRMSPNPMKKNKKPKKNTKNPTFVDQHLKIQCPMHEGSQNPKPKKKIAKNRTM